MSFDSLMQSTTSIYSLHILSCFFMTGLIWLVQLIHYPAYRYMNVDTFTNYQKFHTKTITFIVGPMMVIELFTGLAILFQQKMNIFSSLNFIGLILIWLATVVWSVPKHGQLSDGHNPLVIESLILTNWPRTILWTVRSLLILFLLIETLNINPPP